MRVGITTIIQFGIWKDVMRLMGAEFLRCAAGHGDTLMVHTLLESGVDVNAISDSGLTPLHYAANNGHEEVAKILISFGAEVNARDNLGINPLGYAIDGTHLKTIKTLIPYANLSLQDNCGETVKDLDERKGASNFSDKAEKRVLALRERVKLLVNNIANSDNNIANMQLESRTEAGSGSSTNLANDFANMQLKPRIEACSGPRTKMNVAKAQRTDSEKRKVNTGSYLDLIWSPGKKAKRSLLERV